MKKLFVLLLLIIGCDNETKDVQTYNKPSVYHNDMVFSVDDSTVTLYLGSGSSAMKYIMSYPVIDSNKVIFNIISSELR